jgi:phosphopantothenoylcysteine decarboxylase
MKQVLYVICCAAPPAQHIDLLIEPAQKLSWEVVVVSTPEATKFVDVPRLETLTGYPVRSVYRHPSEPSVLPDPDAVIVCPATFNTINKWALGIADTLALGILCEALGSGLPIVAVPCLKDSLANHPAFKSSLSFLHEAGVTIAYEPKQYKSPAIVQWMEILVKLTNKIYDTD